MLEIKNLNKKFGKKIILDNFTFNFENGTYGVLGPNGTRYILKISTTYPHIHIGARI